MSDADQFQAFVRRFQDMVFATAVRLLGNRTEAEDVAQAVFLRAFQHFDSLSLHPAVAGWLQTVTRHLCLNHLSRYRARWQFFSEMGAGEGDERDLEVQAGALVAPSPAQLLEASERRHELERALRELPDHQRVPLVLFHFEEIGYHEIAQLLGVSVGKVKTDIHRGRLALRALLASSHAPR